jgi:glycosyltransferase involved in cell wall biosynthesis
MRNSLSNDRRCEGARVRRCEQAESELFRDGVTARQCDGAKTRRREKEKIKLKINQSLITKHQSPGNSNSPVTSHESPLPGSSVTGQGSKIVVVPNGVDLEKFRVIEGMSDRGSGLTASEISNDGANPVKYASHFTGQECKIKTSHSRTVAPSHSRNSSRLTTHDSRAKLGFASDKYYLIWVSNPNRPEKNYKFAEEAVKLLNREDIELVPVYNTPNELLPFYYNAADVLLLTSLWEGSPNVIKEAMACNCPIVSTDVGDVAQLIDGVDGCYLADFDPNDFRQRIELALDFGHRTSGRKRIVELGIYSEAIAKKIIELYKSGIEGLRD